MEFISKRTIINVLFLVAIYTFFALHLLSKGDYFLFDIYANVTMLFLMFYALFNLCYFLVSLEHKKIAIVVYFMIVIVVIFLISSVVNIVNTVEDKRAYQNKNYSVVTGVVEGESFYMNELVSVTLNEKEYFFNMKEVLQDEFNKLVDANEDYSMELYYLPNSLEVMEWEIIKP